MHRKSMAKKVKCCQCKHLSRAPYFRKDGTIGPAIYSYSCEADLSTGLSEADIRMFRECSFFRNRTETAWQEIKKDILQNIKSYLGLVTKIFKNKL